MEEEEETLQAKEASGQTSEVTSNLESQINSLIGSGQPLPETVRSYFEPRFGYDFSHVRVISGLQAAESASSINALAYTLGNNVVFGAGQYQPNTIQGKQLLAHELTHVVQQDHLREAVNKGTGVHSEPFKLSIAKEKLLQMFPDDALEKAEKIKSLIHSPDPVAGPTRAHEAFPILSKLNVIELLEVLENLESNDLAELLIQSQATTTSTDTIFIALGIVFLSKGKSFTSIGEITVLIEAWNRIDAETRKKFEDYYINKIGDSLQEGLLLTSIDAIKQKINSLSSLNVNIRLQEIEIIIGTLNAVKQSPFFNQLDPAVAQKINQQLPVLNSTLIKFGKDREANIVREEENIAKSGTAWAAVGTVAVLDGPEPGPADLLATVLAVGVLIGGLFGASTVSREFLKDSDLNRRQAEELLRLLKATNNALIASSTILMAGVIHDHIVDEARELAVALGLAITASAVTRELLCEMLRRMKETARSTDTEKWKKIIATEKGLGCRNVQKRNK